MSVLGKVYCLSIFSGSIWRFFPFNALIQLMCIFVYDARERFNFLIYLFILYCRIPVVPKPCIKCAFGFVFRSRTLQINLPISSICKTVKFGSNVEEWELLQPGNTPYPHSHPPYRGGSREYFENHWKNSPHKWLEMPCL